MLLALDDADIIARISRKSNIVITIPIQKPLHEWLKNMKKKNSTQGKPPIPQRPPLPRL